MMKYLKNNKGFTLVEVIVVAVIVLILAAVAIPLYQGYMRDSRLSVAESTAASIASAISAQIQARSLNATAAIDFVDDDPDTGDTERTLVTINHERHDETTTILVPKGYTYELANDCVTITFANNTDIVGHSPIRSGTVNCP